MHCPRYVLPSPLIQPVKEILTLYIQIPKNLKMMYVHGYQSYIWNTVLSERIRLNGCQAPVVGDIVYADEGSVADAATSVEQEDSVLEDATQTPNTAEDIQQRELSSLSGLSKVLTVIERRCPFPSRTTTPTIEGPISEDFDSRRHQ